MKKKEQREACLKELEGRQTAQLPVRLRAWDSTGGEHVSALGIPTKVGILQPRARAFDARRGGGPWRVI